MGTDIHVTIEHQDGQGHWWTVFSKALYWTDWWGTHVRGLGPDPIAHPDFFQTSPISQTWARDPDLFAALSNVRGQNRISPLLGLPEGQGLAQAGATRNRWHTGNGWPQDASSAARRRYASTDYHSHGVCSWEDLENWRTVLDTRSKGLSQAQRSQRDSLLRWIGCLERCLALTFGDGGEAGRLDKPFTQLAEHEDPDVATDPFAPVDLPSSHAYLAYLEERRHTVGWRAIPHAKLRVLVCYDS